MKIIIINYEKIARNEYYSRAPEIDFRYETKARKVIVDFKFNTLYRYVSREPPEVGGVKS